MTIVVMLEIRLCVSMCVRDTKRELEERTHEVLDMDSALKERQGELQQRAQVVPQTHNCYTRMFMYGVFYIYI